MTIEQVLEANEKAMRFEPQQEVNYPTNLGYPAPAAPSFFEFAIAGQQNDKREAIPKIMKVFESSGAKIVSLSFSNQLSLEFSMNIICDLSSVKCPPDELLIRINKSKFVKLAEMTMLNGRIFGRFTFPLTFFGEVRALAIDSDRFVHLFENITQTFGAKAKDALFESGRLEGRDIIEVLKEKLGEEKSRDKPFILENAQALFQAAGWGKLFFYNDSAEIYKVTVTDPPCDADGEAVLGNYFLHGMVAGMMESFLKDGAKLSMIREGYEEQKKNLILYYMDKASIKELASEDENEREENNDKITLYEDHKLIEPQIKQEEQKVDNKNNEAAVHVAEIIKSIEQIQDVKKKEEETNAVVLSEKVSSAPVAIVQPVQGEMVGSGIEIVQSTEKPPTIKRRKKSSPPPPQDDSVEYSSTDTVKF